MINLKVYIELVVHNHNVILHKFIWKVVFHENIPLSCVERRRCRKMLKIDRLYIITSNIKFKFFEATF